MTILDAIKSFKAFPRYDGEIGLEIETETKKPYDIPRLTYWNVTNDGSLRDIGHEYVLKQPLKFDKEVDAALQEFEEKTKGIKFIKDSVTTSVHVHLNVLNEKFITFGNFLTLYTLYENLLIRYSGPDRLSNLFCLPICDAEVTYRMMVSLMRDIEQKQYRNIFNINEGSAKYAALNLSSLPHYGSIEIRSFRGETDIKSIKDWISILYSIMTFARSSVSPRDIMNLYRENHDKLMSSVFGSHRNKLKLDDEKALVEKNAFYAASIAYSVKNWKDLDQKEESKFKPKAKDLNVFAIKTFGTEYAMLDPGQQAFVFEKLQREWLARNGDSAYMLKADPIVRPRAARLEVNDILDEELRVERDV